jgi:hypothetical protein
VEANGSRIVQFSHFSVKEFLTSTRLSTSSQDVSRYRITLEPAHTILAQACVSVLLQLPDRDKEDVVEKDAPLAYMLPYIGRVMPSLKMWRHRSKEWSIFSTQTNHILRLGACYTT